MHALLTVSSRPLRVYQLPDGHRTLDPEEARRRLEAYAASMPPPARRPRSSARPAVAQAQQAVRSLPPTSPGGPRKPARASYAAALTRVGLLTEEDVGRVVVDDAVPDLVWQLLVQLWETVGLEPDPVRLLDDHDTRVATFRACCRIRQQPGEDEIHLPDGTSVRVAPGTAAEAIEQRCDLLGAVETARQVVTHNVAESGPGSSAPVDATEARIVETSLRCWTVEVEGAEPARWDPLDHAGGPLPQGALMPVLDELADAGWRIRHVSEDRAVDHDANASFVVAIRYLLTRY